MTLGVERRRGQSGESDTQLTMGVNYQLGVPWITQVDPPQMSDMRSLTGSRYDLVEPTTTLCWSTAKKDIIRLHSADLVPHSGEQKSLGFSVTSTYGLTRID